MSSLAPGLPIDWTTGTGVFPGGASIPVPANKDRKWLFVQNQDLGTVQIQLSSVKASDGTTATVTLYLAPGAASGSQGGANENTLFGFLPLGAVTVVGISGQKVAVLEG